MTNIDDIVNQRMVPDSGDYYISYNPSVNQGNGETAIVTMNIEHNMVDANPQFFTLNGDWREEYEEVIDKGIESCMAIFDKHKDNYMSIFSSSRGTKL